MDPGVLVSALSCLSEGFSLLPQLLVSVCDAQEAVAAVRGGAQIIDVKNPFQGPLGRADVETIRNIIAVLSTPPYRRTISAALGETQEWMCELSSEQQEWMAFLHTCRDLQFLKLGTAGLLSVPAAGNHGDQSAAGVGQADPAATFNQTSAIEAVDWKVTLESVRLQLLGSATMCSESSDTGGNNYGPYPAWISVAYADFQRCHAPSLDQVVAAAVRSGSRGLLVDTYVKDGSRLLDCCTISTLHELRQITRESQLLFAVAGQLRIDDLERLVPIAPDIIAVRGAVCQRGLRTCGVQGALVREFANAVARCFRAPEIHARSVTGQ